MSRQVAGGETRRDRRSGLRQERLQAPLDGFQFGIALEPGNHFAVYAGTVTLACSLATYTPSNAQDLPTCSVASPAVTLSSTVTRGTATVTVTTAAAATGRLVHPHLRDKDGRWFGGGAVLALLIFLGIPARRRGWRSMLGAVALMAALGGLAACGDFWEPPGGSTTAGTTAGTYTFTVTGTGNPTVTPVTTTFTVTVN